MAIACLTTIVVVISVTPLFVFPLVIIIALQLWTSQGYIEVSRDLRRIESILRSPIIASFSELVSTFLSVRSSDECLELPLHHSPDNGNLHCSRVWS